MTMTVNWDNDQHTRLHYYFYSDGEDIDFRSAINQARLMFSSVPHLVDVIVEIHPTAHVPIGMISKMTFLVPDSIPNLGRVVMVSGNRLIRGLYQVYQTSYGKDAPNCHFVSTLAEAYEILEGVST